MFLILKILYIGTSEVRRRNSTAAEEVARSLDPRTSLIVGQDIQKSDHEIPMYIYGLPDGDGDLMRLFIHKVVYIYICVCVIVCVRIYIYKLYYV